MKREEDKVVQEPEQLKQPPEEKFQAVDLSKLLHLETLNPPEAEHQIPELKKLETKLLILRILTELRTDPRELDLRLFLQQQEILAFQMEDLISEETKI